MPLSPELSAQLRQFYLTSAFIERGGIITDLDGTAVHERDGTVFIAESVTRGLKALVELGRPVVINTLRFPLNVIRTFGRAWSAFTAEPVLLVSLNGGMLGFLTPTEAGETTFDEVAAFPIADAQIDETVDAFAALVKDGIDNLVLFHYARDWRRGETIWTSRPERIAGLEAKYRSASTVRSSSLEELRDSLHREGAIMLSVVADIPDDRRMAYQHANPNRFVSATGVDKLFGAQEAARFLGFDLESSIGCGDTPMDSFLAGVGLAMHVGPMHLEFRGTTDTVRVRDPSELGDALYDLAGMESDEQHAA